MSATTTTPTSHVSFADLTPPNSDPCCSSSPVRASFGFNLDGHRDLVPLAPSKTVLAVSALSRKGVIFSPRNDTKYFHAQDSILPTPSTSNLPPPSIRSYPDSDPISSSNPYNTPSSSRTHSPHPQSDPSSSLVRSILKQRYSEIRLAATVEEGTLNNKEPARLVVTGKRPRLMARDSFQLAMMRKAAGDETPQKGNGKGKERMVDDVPGSDDSVGQDEDERQVQGMYEPSSEIEEELEADGALATRSLVDIILDGAEDLLTLEEAYNTLGIRLRQKIPVGTADNLILGSVMEEITMATQPIRDEAPAMVRAMTRDLQRLMGKVPNSEVPPSEAESSPFKGLTPLIDSTPTNTRSRFTPSPTPVPASSKITPGTPKTFRQGYTEAEVRYRREASGVGAAAMRFLSFVFHTPHLHSCFSEVDITSLLEQVMIIPRTPKLPTPNTKRSYYLSMLILSNLRVPPACVSPVKDKISRAVESGMADTLGTGPVIGLGGKDGPSQPRKEGYNAAANLLSTYPQIFFHQYAELLPGILRGMSSTSPIVRVKASAAASAFALAKTTLVSPPISSRDNWIRAKQTSQKLEFFIISHLKSGIRQPGKSVLVYLMNGEKKTEWNALEQVFKDTVGNIGEVGWACASWASLVTLMGSGYATSGLAGAIDHIMDRSLQASTNAVRPLLARTAWNHAIHAYLLSGFSTSLTDDLRIIQSFKPFPETEAADRYKSISLPVDLALQAAHDSANYTREVIESGTRYNWSRNEKSKKLQWMITCGLGAASLVFAHTVVALCHEEQPAKEMMMVSGLPSSDGGAVPEWMVEEAKMERLDKTWDIVVSPLLESLATVNAVDRLKVHAWAILASITSPVPATPSRLTLDRLLSTQYLNGDMLVEKSKEGVLSELLDGLDREAVKAGDIPSWGSAWGCRRLDALLGVFEECLKGLTGLSDLNTIKWVRDDRGEMIVPVLLSKVWGNIMSMIGTHSNPGEALGKIVEFLAEVFSRNPADHVPLRTLSTDGHLSTDPDAFRINLMNHLLDSLVKAVTPSILATRIPKTPARLPVPGNDNDHAVKDITSKVFGADSDGYTLGAALLGYVLRSNTLGHDIRDPARESIRKLLKTLFGVISSSGISGRILGDLTNHMPWIFADQEEIQLDIWRALVMSWIQLVDLQPATTASTTNHTGALLVSLLSGPFRGRQVDSAWHQSASKEDLEVWQALLRVAVLRFRAKRAGSNLGVLESLAGHLGDFLKGDKTSSTTITLSCLASATTWISFIPQENYDQSHYSINENYVPIEFLGLLSKALVESYPHTETLAASGGATVSPAVGDVIDALSGVFGSIPGEFVERVLAGVKPGVAMWLTDESRIVGDRVLASKLDQLYVTLLSALAGAITNKHLPASASNLNDLLEIIAPRLSRAQTQAVPNAFKAFWRENFTDVEASDMSDDVVAFLSDVLAAVPGMISVKGLASENSLSEEESQDRFPHALIQDEQKPKDETPVEAEVEVIEIAESTSEAEPEVIEDVLVERTEAEINPADSASEAEPKVNEDVLVEPTEVEINPADLIFNDKPEGPVLTAIERSPVAPSPIDPSTTHLEDTAGEYVPDITGDYDADVSQSTGSRRPPPTSPCSSEADSEQRVSDEAGSLEAGDVFGPGGVTSSNVKKGKKRAKKTRRTFLDGVSRTRHIDSVLGLAGPSGPVELAPPGSQMNPLVADSDDEVGDCIIVQQSPPVLRPIARVSQTAAKSPGIPPKAGLLSSAGRWLAKASSISGLFSPSQAAFGIPQAGIEEDEEEGDDPAVSTARIRRGRRGKGRASASGGKSRTSSDVDMEVHDNEVGTPGKRKMMVIVEVPDRRRKRTKSEGPDITMVERGVKADLVRNEDDEDELLLSPEEGRKRKREEEAEIEARHSSVSTTATPSPKKRSRTRSQHRIEQVEVEQPQSQFEDAQEPDPQSLPTPDRRSTQQKRLLAMTQAAAQSHLAIKGLDLPGVLELMKNVEVLREAATANLAVRAEEERQAARARIGRK